MPITSNADSVAAGNAAKVSKNVPAKMDATPAVPTSSFEYTAGLYAFTGEAFTPPMGFTPIGFTLGFLLMLTVLNVVGLDFLTVPAVLVMVYFDVDFFATTFFAGTAFFAVVPNRGFFATGFFATGFLGTAFFTTGLGLGFDTMGLTAAVFLGGAAVFLPKNATAAEGCWDREGMKVDERFGQTIAHIQNYPTIRARCSFRSGL